MFKITKSLKKKKIKDGKKKMRKLLRAEDYKKRSKVESVGIYYRDQVGILKEMIKS